MNFSNDFWVYTLWQSRNTFSWVTLILGKLTKYLWRIRNPHWMQALPVVISDDPHGSIGFSFGIKLGNSHRLHTVLGKYNVLHISAWQFFIVSPADALDHLHGLGFVILHTILTVECPFLSNIETSILKGDNVVTNFVLPIKLRAFLWQQIIYCMM